ncbi:polyphosphate:AMP phosphotransferase [Rhodobacteraceae bacterium RKSG542]|uniref:polyphosphate:AMP phosphotransferase n=1 Tax=Pseudovibrio flavus TaxID=2529854 RepID=UPI0012BC23CA|nr:polyphosphate:AMP phosphotransferase [Pseudovibrio flavus]MTI18542.1 polyphosphate:AMP phosphotransferase [Pseudovibrio flavus]
MFQSADLPQNISKEDFEARLPALREELLDAQHKLQENKDFAVVIVMAGLDGAGKGAAISRLYEWMDTRYLFCNAYPEKRSEEEKLRPRMWRYWRDLPARGEVSVVLGSWYQKPLGNYVYGKTDDDGLERQLSAINRFERMLTHENVLLLKFWFTLPTDEQKKRLDGLKGFKSHRHYFQEWTNLDNHRKAQLAGEKAAIHTSTGYAPWVVIPSQDPEYRDLAMGETIADAITRKLEDGKSIPNSAPAVVSGISKTSAVDAIDLSATLSKDDYKQQLEHWQDRVAQLMDKKRFQKRSLVCVFQGNDAAGKGGAIRRLTRSMDPRTYKVYPIAAPSEEENLHPYLWRFWRRIPKKGHAAIFDRSWYERILVERIEGFCSESDWLRAYNEINFFESDLTNEGVILCKFWLAISEEEQLRRFKAREETAYKNYKITEEDWRNRLKWQEYSIAAGDMVDRTSTRNAPWTLVASEDKRYARIKVLKTVCQTLEKALDKGK